MAIVERGQEKTCINHPDRSAVARCITCHKPLCQECTISTSAGKFCSRTCADKAADFKAGYKGPIKVKAPLIHRLLKTVFVVVVIIVALGIVNRFKHIPVIGKFLDDLPVIGKSE